MRFAILTQIPPRCRSAPAGKTFADFQAALADLVARGFPQADPRQAISTSRQSIDGAMLVTRTCSALPLWRRPTPAIWSRIGLRG